MSILGLIFIPILIASASPMQDLKARATKSGFDHLAESIEQNEKVCEGYRSINAPGVPTYAQCLQSLTQNAENILACPTSPQRYHEAVDFDLIQIPEFFGKFATLSPPKEMTDIFNRLTIVADQLYPARFSAHQWSLIGYEHGVPNATAALNGTIFISRAFWKGTSFDLQDATGVLAHEISHVLAEHSLILGCQTIEWIGAHNTIEEATRAFREELVDGYPRKEAWKKKSQAFEYEADLIGARLLKSAGLDPLLMVRVLEKLSSGADGGFTTGSHPDMKVRIEILRKRIGEL